MQSGKHFLMRSINPCRMTYMPVRSNVFRFYLSSPVSTTYSSVDPTNASKKQLKAESFNLPKQETVQSSVKDLLPEIHAELRDFQLTKIIHGSTDLKIGITDRARDKLVDIAVKDNKPETALRIQVESGGCHGFQYNLDLTTLPEALAKEENLVVFQRTDAESATVVFDESSLEILQDSKIDFTKELIGASFKVVDSPYTSTSCGCGASFDFDFEKLEQEKANKSHSK